MQIASRGDSLSVSDGVQELKLVRSGALKSVDPSMQTEVLKVVDKVKGFTLQQSLLEDDLTLGMKQDQISSNGDTYFSQPRFVFLPRAMEPFG